MHNFTAEKNFTGQTKAISMQSRVMFMGASIRCYLKNKDLFA